MGKTLVTGAAGFIGSRLVERLQPSQVITDSDNQHRTNLQSKEEVLNLDVADTVVHLGGKTPKEELEWHQFFENNILGTLNILEYCMKKKAERLIYISSYVYGRPEYCPIDEKHPVNPHNAYTESKYIGERLCQFYCSRSSLDLTILRPFNIFGESMKGGFLLSNLIGSVNGESKLTITNKKSRRDFLHVDDLVDLILKLLDYDSKFDVFNVGSGQSLSFEEIVGKAEKISSKRLDVTYEEDKESFIEDIRADITKIKTKTGWQPRIGFDEGLQRTLNAKS